MRRIYKDYKLPLRKAENVEAFFEEGLTHLGENGALLDTVLDEVRSNHKHVTGEQLDLK